MSGINSWVGERNRSRGGVKSGFSGLGALMRGWEDEKEVGEDGSKHIKGGQLLELGCPHK